MAIALVLLAAAYALASLIAMVYQCVTSRGPWRRVYRLLTAPVWVLMVVFGVLGIVSEMGMDLIEDYEPSGER